MRVSGGRGSLARPIRHSRSDGRFMSGKPHTDCLAVFFPLPPPPHRSVPPPPLPPFSALSRLRPVFFRLATTFSLVILRRLRLAVTNEARVLASLHGLGNTDTRFVLVLVWWNLFKRRVVSDEVVAGTAEPKRWGKEGRLYLTIHCLSPLGMISALRWAAMRAILMFY